MSGPATFVGWRDRVWITPRLLSLLDVLEFTKISHLLVLSQSLRTLEKVLDKHPPDAGKFPVEERSEELDVQALFIEMLRRLVEAAGELDIPWLEGRYERLADQWGRGRIGSETLRYGAAEIAADLRGELASKTFFVLEGRDGEYHTDSLLLTEAASRFPSASEELNEAGKCFALGRYTASVFHAMRALEPALEALRLNVRAPKKGSWGPIIDQIEAKIRQVQTGGTRSTEARKRFLSEAAAEFRHLKDAWRNHAMHTHQRYDRETAQRVLEHAKTFVEHLAGRLRERRGSRRQ